MTNQGRSRSSLERVSFSMAGRSIVVAPPFSHNAPIGSLNCFFCATREHSRRGIRLILKCYHTALSVQTKPAPMTADNRTHSTNQLVLEKFSAAPFPFLVHGLSFGHQSRADGAGHAPHTAESHGLVNFRMPEHSG